MSWIDSPWRAAIAGALTSAPLGWLAHKRKPSTYDSKGQAVGFAALLGSLSGVAWYWGIQRYMRDNLSSGTAPKLEPEAVALARKQFADDNPWAQGDMPPGFGATRFACGGSYLNYYGIAHIQPGTLPANALMYLGTWRGDSHTDAQRFATEAGFRTFWPNFFPNGIWAMGQNCNADWGSYRVT